MFVYGYTRLKRSRTITFMLSYVSLWSADLLDIGRAIDLVADSADGFHIDIFDGHNADELLFGPDFVKAVRNRTDVLLDVHLNVSDPDKWAQRFIDVGADMVSVQSSASLDIIQTLSLIREQGAKPSLGIEIHESIKSVFELRDFVDRYLMMGTPIGVKGRTLEESIPERISELRSLLLGMRKDIPIFIDGGIRANILEIIAEAGADGVIPGSLVFGDSNPCAALERIAQINFRGN